MKVVVTNAVLSNTGDAAIYAAIVSSLERAFDRKITVSVFDSNARVTSNLYPQWTITQQMTVSPPRSSIWPRRVLQGIRRELVRRVGSDHGSGEIIRRALRLPLLRSTQFARSTKALREADVLVSSGGTYLVDHYDFTPRCDEFELAKHFGKPIYLWTQSLGPFGSERSQALADRVAASVDVVFFRDHRSMAAWERIAAVPKGSEVVPDVVFALPVKPRASAQPPSRRALISVRAWNTGIDAAALDGHTYQAAMRQFAGELIERDWQVDALSTCQGVRSYAHDDSLVAAQVFRGTAVTVNRDFHSPATLLEEVSSAGLVVATRMHLSIMALISQVPVVAIAYEFKTLELFQGLGLGEFVIAIEDITPEWAKSTLERVLDDPSQCVLSADHLESLRVDADKPSHVLWSAGLGKLHPR